MKYLLLIICLAGLSQESYASNHIDDHKVPTQKDTLLPSHQLRQVVIRSIHTQNRQLQSPTPVQIMDKTAMKRLNSLSVADAVRYFSGVQLKDYGGIGGLKTINVRSMGAHHTSVFYNGMPLGNAQNGQVDLGKFSLKNLKMMKLFNGQNSNIFQPASAYASGAILSLHSKTPQFNQGHQTHLGASFQKGSFGMSNTAIHWEQKITQHISSMVSAEHLHANGRYSFRYTNGIYDTSATRHNADITAWRAEAALQGTLPDSGSWHIHGYHYQSKRGLPGAVVANHFNHYQRLWNKDQFVQANLTKKLSDKQALQFNTKYSYHYTHYLDPSFPNDQNQLSNYYREKEFYASLADRYHLTPYWDADFSVDYHWDKLHANTYHFPSPSRHSLLAVLATKFHFSSLQMEGSLLGTFVRDKTKKYGKNSRQSEYSPSISFSWQPFHLSHVHVRGFYKNIFRMPTFNDLYYGLMGTTKLRPEFVDQFDVGLTYHKSFENSRLRFTSIVIDLYHNRVTNKIIATPGSNLFRWQMSNLGKGDTKGIDVHAKNQFFIDRQVFLQIGLNYTFQKALNVTDKNYQYKNEIPYAPKHSGSVTTSLDWKKWHLNYSFLYTGARYTHQANTAKDYLPAWFTHDLSLHKTWEIKRCQVTLSAEIHNIANHRYEVLKGYPMPGRSYRIGIDISI